MVVWVNVLCILVEVLLSAPISLMVSVDVNTMKDDVLGTPSLASLVVSVDVKHHERRRSGRGAANYPSA